MSETIQGTIYKDCEGRCQRPYKGRFIRTVRDDVRDHTRDDYKDCEGDVIDDTRDDL